MLVTKQTADLVRKISKHEEIHNKGEGANHECWFEFVVKTNELGAVNSSKFKWS